MNRAELEYCRKTNPDGCSVFACPRNKEKLKMKNMNSQSPVWIVVSSEGVASNPMEHNSYASASNEARRLARLKPVVKFHVYQRVLTVKQEAAPLTETVYKVEDMPF